MALSTKKHGDRTYAFGLSGKAGTGKSYAIIKMTKNPYIFDLDKKLPPELKGHGDVWDDKGRLTFHYLKMELINVLNEQKLPYDFIVIDNFSKMEELCEAWAIEADYKGDKSKYSAYQTGAKHELPQYFAELLDILTRIRERHGIKILAICHAKNKPYNNAFGKDYVKWMLDLREECATRALKWFDYLGFVYDDVELDEKGLRAKAEDQTRYISFDNTSPVFDAKAITPVTPKTLFDKEGKWVETIFGKEAVAK